MKIRNKKFIYLISPPRIIDKSFYYELNLVFKSNKISFFQLRLKKENTKTKIFIAKKIIKICKKYNVKFIINDDPYLALKVKADGCHLGQKDMNAKHAKQILKDKIIYLIKELKQTSINELVEIRKQKYLNITSDI